MRNNSFGHIYVKKAKKNKKQKQKKNRHSFTIFSSTEKKHCFICQIPYEEDDALRLHVMQHLDTLDEEKEDASLSAIGLRCAECDKRLSSTVDYKKHLLDVHGGFRFHVCPRGCGRTSFLKSELNAHASLCDGR